MWDFLTLFTTAFDYWWLKYIAEIIVNPSISFFDSINSVTLKSWERRVIYPYCILFVVVKSFQMFIFLFCILFSDILTSNWVGMCPKIILNVRAPPSLVRQCLSNQDYSNHIIALWYWALSIVWFNFLLDGALGLELQASILFRFKFPM